MKRGVCALSIIPAFAFAALWPCSASAAGDDLNTDPGLLAFVLRSDLVLLRVAGECRNVSITRSGQPGHVDFGIKAECAIKDNREENADCPAYKVDAFGTLDSPTQATMRKITLSLLCSA